MRDYCLLASQGGHTPLLVSEHDTLSSLHIQVSILDRASRVLARLVLLEMLTY